MERLNQIGSVQEVELTCCENDENILELLKENLEYCKECSPKNISVRILTDNYITSQYLDFNCMLGSNPNPVKYDFIIGNPPYMKIAKDAPEATTVPELCYGVPNMYFIFAAMGLFNLKDDGEMVYIIPRSWTSGAYFKCFRQYFLTEGKLEHIHLFVSRNKVFDKEDVLQETIIIKSRKAYETPETVTITSSKPSSDFDVLTSFTVPYNLVVSGEDYYVYLAKNYPQYKKTSTQNKINFIDGLMTEMSECLVYGLYVLFNSTLYDEYYRILNGSTQVNSTEINSMPVPDLKSIQEMGRNLMINKDFSEDNCNLILEEYCG